jgi:hypothetical protein
LMEEAERMPRCLRLWAETVDQVLGGGWEILALEMRGAAVLIDYLASNQHEEVAS